MFANTIAKGLLRWWCTSNISSSSSVHCFSSGISSFLTMVVDIICWQSSDVMSGWRAGRACCMSGVRCRNVQPVWLSLQSVSLQGLSTAGRTEPWPTKVTPSLSPLWTRELCRISPHHFLSECRVKRLNHGSFVLLYFASFAFSELFIYFVVCLFLICLLSCIFQREPTWMILYSLIVLMCR